MIVITSFTTDRGLVASSVSSTFTSDETANESFTTRNETFSSSADLFQSESAGTTLSTSHFQQAGTFRTTQSTIIHSGITNATLTSNHTFGSGTSSRITPFTQEGGAFPPFESNPKTVNESPTPLELNFPTIIASTARGTLVFSGRGPSVFNNTATAWSTATTTKQTTTTTTPTGAQTATTATISTEATTAGITGLESTILGFTLTKTLTSEYGTTTREDTDTVSPLTARTFRVSYPDVDQLMYAPFTSSEVFDQFFASALETTDSYQFPSVYEAVETIDPPVLRTVLTHRNLTGTYTYESLFGTDVETTRQSVAFGAARLLTRTGFALLTDSVATEATFISGIEIISATSRFQNTGATVTSTAYGRNSTKKFVSAIVVTETKTYTRAFGNTTGTSFSFISAVSTTSYSQFFLPSPLGTSGETLTTNSLSNRTIGSTYTFLKSPILSQELSLVGDTLRLFAGTYRGIRKEYEPGAVLQSGNALEKTDWGIGITWEPSEFTQAQFALSNSVVISHTGNANIFMPVLRDPPFTRVFSVNQGIGTTAFSFRQDGNEIKVRSALWPDGEEEGDYPFSLKFILSEKPLEDWKQLQNVFWPDQYERTVYARPIAQIKSGGTTISITDPATFTIEAGESFLVNDLSRVTANSISSLPGPIALTPFTNFGF